MKTQKDDKKSKERRKEKRISLKGDILVDGAIMFQCIDISEGGIYLYTGRTFPENKEVTVTLPIKSQPLELKAQVKHIQPGIGMGLQFIELTDEQKTILKKLMLNIMKKSKRPSEGRKKILLVEDNDLSRQIHKSNLSKEGFSVLEARDGIEAINLLKECDADLMILDLFMEKIDGFKVLKILRNNPKWEELPVIVFSGRGTADVLEKVTNAGADEFLVKMLTSPAKLANTVKTVLQRRKKNQSL